MARTRDLERHYPARQFAGKLRRLAAALEAGRPFRLQLAGERLTIPADAHISIEHERAHGTAEIEFQLRWRA
ncbi:MAG TPA: amphi-Trp domain-containing protein [bacterium]|nr:amphi-Trp domain-containing protein [bacterium]